MSKILCIKLVTGWEKNIYLKYFRGNSEPSQVYEHYLSKVDSNKEKHSICVINGLSPGYLLHILA